MGTIIKMKYHSVGAIDNHNTDLSLEEKVLSEIMYSRIWDKNLFLSFCNIPHISDETPSNFSNH